MYRSYYVPLKEFKNNSSYFTNDRIVNRICRSQILSKKFMREMKDKLNWNLISQYQKLDEDFIEEMKDKIVWSSLIRYNKKVHLSESFIEKMVDYLDWDAVSSCVSVSKEFVLKHLDKLNPDRIQDNYQMREIFDSFEEFANMFLRYNRHSFKWEGWNYPNMSIEFVREYADVIKFERIIPLFVCSNNREKFVEEFNSYFNEEAWMKIECRLYEFDFDFIIKYSDHWKYLKYNNPANNLFRHVKFTEDEIKNLNRLWELRNNKY